MTNSADPYWAGREAHDIGISETANPYPIESTDHLAWNDGWWDADQEKGRAVTPAQARTVALLESGFAVSGPNLEGRYCGGCTACCTLVPVSAPPDLEKGANTRCPHQTDCACAIYPARPEPCRYWNCRWLFDPASMYLDRPDRSGYVIDCLPDVLLVDDIPRDVLQVWCDPARPDAHRDPALRAYLEIFARRFAMGAIVRWSQDSSLTLLAPFLNGTSEWMEVTGETATLEAVNEGIAAAEGRP